MHYFAYGSNMHHLEMKIRCPDSRFIGTAALRGYRFVYDGYSRSCRGGIPNVIRSRPDTVWGGLFIIGPLCLKALDDYEGYPSTYQRGTVPVTDDKNRTFHAIVYYRTGRHPSRPSHEFQRIVMEGARDCRLPKEYIIHHLG